MLHHILALECDVAHILEYDAAYDRCSLGRILECEVAYDPLSPQVLSLERDNEMVPVNWLVEKIRASYSPNFFF